MAPVLYVLLAALPVFAVPEDMYFDHEYSDRIIEGVQADIEDFPFVVALIYTITYAGTRVITGLCGGAILTEEWVLTTANCADANIPGIRKGSEVQLSYVRAGSSYKDRGGITRRVTRIVTHEKRAHNIGLVKVDGLLPLDGITMTPARLPRQDDAVHMYRKATIVGWGAVDFKGTPPDRLTKEEVVITTLATCNTHLGARFVATDAHICTFFNPAKTLVSTSKGDAGAPLVANGVVIGIFTGLLIRNYPLPPDIHTRVSYFIDWIKNTVGPGTSLLIAE